MQNSTQNDETPTRLEVVITLEGGKQMVVDISPLQKLFNFDSFITPQDIGRKLQNAMDSMVIWRNDEGSAVDLSNDYDFLCAVRNAFNEMSWKEVISE